MYGYKALILLRMDTALGMKAPCSYIKRYGSDHPLESIGDVKST